MAGARCCRAPPIHKQPRTAGISRRPPGCLNAVFGCSEKYMTGLGLERTQACVSNPTGQSRAHPRLRARVRHETQTCTMRTRAAPTSVLFVRAHLRNRMYCLPLWPTLHITISSRWASVPAVSPCLRARAFQPSRHALRSTTVPRSQRALSRQRNVRRTAILPFLSLARRPATPPRPKDMPVLPPRFSPNDWLAFPPTSLSSTYFPASGHAHRPIDFQPSHHARLPAILLSSCYDRLPMI